MKFQGALVKEQGVTFGLVVVKPRVLRNGSERERLRAAFGAVFGVVPIVLMAQDSRGVPTYQGRSDIVRFLTRVSLQSIPWREYTVN
jgi:hypothetical protein